MNDESADVNVILVPIDFSDVTAKLIETAGRYARAMGSRVILLHVIEPDVPLIAYEPGPLPVITPETMRTHEEEEKQLALLRDHMAAGGIEVEANQLTGNLVTSIVETGRNCGADLIVMGSHGHGAVYNLLVGSVANGVLKSAICPVLVVPSDRKG